MQRHSTTSPLLSLPGAVAAEGRDEGVAAHYGDLFREQRALSSGEGFVDLSHRGVVAVSGDDRLSWLHLLLTQYMTDLPPGRATEALILSANGHIEHALYLVDDGETVWAHVEPGTQGELIAYLESMKFFYRVEVADRTEDTAVVHLPAGSIAGVPEGVVVRETPHGRDLFPAPRRPGVLRRLARPGGRDPRVRGAAGGGVPAPARLRDRPPDHPARDRPHRRRRPPPEGLLPGQETVARVQNLGKPPRRLVFLHLDGSEVLLPGHGTPVRLASDGEDGRQLGFVTTAVRHHELGPIALALVKRNVPVDAPLVAGTTAAAQETVVEP